MKYPTPNKIELDDNIGPDVYWPRKRKNAKLQRTGRKLRYCATKYWTARNGNGSDWGYSSASISPFNNEVLEHCHEWIIFATDEQILDEALTKNYEDDNLLGKEISVLINIRDNLRKKLLTKIEIKQLEKTD